MLNETQFCIYAVSRAVRMTLLLAYARTGSTLTGEILTLQSKNFYLFEPLHGLIKSLQNQTEVTFLNGSTRLVFLIIVFYEKVKCIL